MPQHVILSKGGLTVQKIKENPIVKSIGMTRVILILVIIALYILFTIMTPILRPGTSFVSLNRILSAFNYCYFLGFLALGVMFVIATGEIDFSIGPVMFCSALISGYCLTSYHLPMVLCLIISVLVGTAFGIWNGYFVSYRYLPSFITSLASMQIAKGVGAVFTKTQSVSWPAAGSEGGAFRNLIRIGNVPVGFIILCVVAILVAIFMNKTKAGRYIVCLGSNKEAVRLSGVNTKRWQMLAFIICGVFAGIAAIFYVGAYTTVQPGLGDTLNNDAIAACVMGGTAMTGGVVSVLGVIIGAIVVSLLQEGILAMGFTVSHQYILTGIIVLVAVILNMTGQKRKN